MEAHRIHVLRFGWGEIPPWKRAAILVLGAAIAIAAGLLLSFFVLLLLPLALLVGLLARLLLARPTAGDGPERREGPGGGEAGGATIEGEWRVIEESRSDPADRRR
ncbi:MAG: hypothetical protein KIT81_00375 [Alphaproteobacteria bacterium]|nr:hypothetical protein [Alphaproteobacteria bacterium]